MTPNSFSLRDATEKDAIKIKDLVREGQINPIGLNWQRFIVVETSESEVIGCGQVKPHRDGSKELASLVVTQAWRGRGVAKQIIEELLSRNVDDLYLMCQSSLGPLYQKFHFKRVPEVEMPKYFRRISKLVGVIEPLMKRGETLLIMVHKGKKESRHQ